MLPVRKHRQVATAPAEDDEEQEVSTDLLYYHTSKANHQPLCSTFPHSLGTSYKCMCKKEVINFQTRASFLKRTCAIVQVET